MLNILLQNTLYIPQTNTSSLSLLFALLLIIVIGISVAVLYDSYTKEKWIGVLKTSLFVIVGLVIVYAIAVLFLIPNVTFS